MERPVMSIRMSQVSSCTLSRLKTTQNKIFNNGVILSSDFTPSQVQVVG